MDRNVLQQFANLRAYYGFMWAHPGKKLLFMGSEFAQDKEWNFDKELEWHLLDRDFHKGVQKLVADLNHLYSSSPALYEKDCEASGFEWIDCSNAEQSIYSFVRYTGDREKLVLVVCNFTPQTHHQFRLGVPVSGFYKEVFNSDAEIYGGSNQGNLGGVKSSKVTCNERNDSIEITIPPLSTIMFEVG